jgi:hypothetical protein
MINVEKTKLCPYAGDWTYTGSNIRFCLATVEKTSCEFTNKPEIYSRCFIQIAKTNEPI